MLAASTHCQTAPTYNGRCACLNDSLAKLIRLQQMEAHPNVTAMLVTLFVERQCLAVRSIFVDFVESSSLAVERDCASAMKKDPTVLPPLSSGKARLRLCEDMKRKYTHTRDTAETGHGGFFMSVSCCFVSVSVSVCVLFLCVTLVVVAFLGCCGVCCVQEVCGCCCM